MIVTRNRGSYAGLHVTVTWRDGTTTTGTLRAWGPQVIRVRTRVTDGPWARTVTIERSTTQIERVESTA